MYGGKVWWSPVKIDNVVHALEADGRGLVRVIKLSIPSFEKLFIILRSEK